MVRPVGPNRHDEAAASEALDPRQRARFGFGAAEAWVALEQPARARERASAALALLETMRESEGEDPELERGIERIQTWLAEMDRSAPALERGR